MKTPAKSSEQDTANIHFTLDRLRQDNIIHATETSATNLACLLAFFFSKQYLRGMLKDVVNIGALLLAVGYTLSMFIGNFYRRLNIRKVERGPMK